ncbi:MAG: IS701 family transposase, partial [Actinomycetota bacterium]|nr:IS701 family transposase [Actinomycetota bacterium]
MEQIGSWKEQLEALQARIAPRFARPEVRARAGRYLWGLLEPVERRNGWQLAERIGEERPDGVQRLLNGARWDAGEVRDDLRAYVVEHLGDPEAVLVVDETGFLKKGEKSVGVSRQYSGTAGKVENCQIGVFLAYATPRGGRAFLDRALYLPEEEWAKDESRREAAGIPEEVGFATKGELARKMIERALEAEVPASWVTADEVYANDGALRRWLEAQGRSYVLAVSRSHPLATLLSGSRRAEEIVAEAPAEAWERVEVGAGSKGTRLYDWARARLRYVTEEGWAQWLLVRRSVSSPEEMAYYRAYAPQETSLAELARVAATRWSIEECFERAKGDVGLDHYEVRRWEGWHRHITLCLLAHAFLEATRIRANGEEEKGPSVCQAAVEISLSRSAYSFLKTASEIR